MALVEFQNNTAPYINADNLNNNFNYLDEKATISDTGWITINQTDLTQGEVATGYYVPAYRKIGNIVYLKGQITGITSRATEIFKLPNNYFNSNNRYSFCTTNDNTDTNFIRINNAGIVVLQRSTGNFTSGINIYLDGIYFTTD